MPIAAGFVRMLKISEVNNNYSYLFLDEAYEDSTCSTTREGVQVPISGVRELLNDRKEININKGMLLLHMRTPNPATRTFDQERSSPSHGLWSLCRLDTSCRGVQ